MIHSTLSRIKICGCLISLLSLLACSEGSFSGDSRTRSPSPPTPEAPPSTDPVTPDRETGKREPVAKGVIEDETSPTTKSGSTSAEEDEAGGELFSGEGEITCSPDDGHVIDFETFPGGKPPEDGETVSTQFEASHGLVFRLQGGGHPVIARRGPPMTSHFCDQCFPQEDGVEDGEGLGEYFLTDDGVVGATAQPLIVEYTLPVRAASGVIVDLDDIERWEIKALDSQGNVVASTILASEDIYYHNGLGTGWQLSVDDSSEEMIHSLVFSGTGSTSFGLAFDQFSPRRVCQFD